MTEIHNTNVRRYSPGEEIVNSVTHGIGTALSVAGLVILVIFAVLRGDLWHVVGFSIFGGTLIFLYASSTLYHSFSKPSVKAILREIDHSAVFLLIAGTYTPFTLVTLRGVWGWSMLGVVWALAIVGISTKFVRGFKFRGLSIGIYLFMGWMGVVAIKQIVSGVPMTSLILLIIGGLAYTTGVVFYCSRTVPFHHGIWHIFVLCGSVSHYFAVLCIALYNGAHLYAALAG